eukprot:c2355_g1_i1.p1 GENE.c2355_g1_i1~~c2355_g1_i1.p1  ORF type:complete len:936 (+),score=196.25 c2355_g1_i1:116-2809(+)
MNSDRSGNTNTSAGMVSEGRASVTRLRPLAPVTMPPPKKSTKVMEGRQGSFVSPAVPVPPTNANADSNYSSSYSGTNTTTPASPIPPNIRTTTPPPLTPKHGIVSEGHVVIPQGIDPEARQCKSRKDVEGFVAAARQAMLRVCPTASISSRDIEHMPQNNNNNAIPNLNTTTTSTMELNTSSLHTSSMASTLTATTTLSQIPPTPAKDSPSSVGSEISVLSWNVLAQGLSSPSHKPPPLPALKNSILQYAGLDALPQPDHVLLDFDLRKWRIIEEVIQSECDVCMLCECDRFNDFFAPVMAKLGYCGTFQPNCQSLCPSFGYYSDGCAVFWRQSVFDLIQASGLEDPPTALAILKHKQTNRPVVFACTYLHHSPLDPHDANRKSLRPLESFILEEKIRESQCSTLLSSVTRLAELHGTTLTLVGGDFDSDPYQVMVGDGVLDPLCVNLIRKCDYNSVYELTMSEEDTMYPYTTSTSRFGMTSVRMADYLFHSHSLTCMSRDALPMQHVNKPPLQLLPNFQTYSHHLPLVARFAVPAGKGMVRESTAEEHRNEATLLNVLDHTTTTTANSRGSNTIYVYNGARRSSGDGATDLLMNERAGKNKWGRTELWGIWRFFCLLSVALVVVSIFLPAWYSTPLRVTSQCSPTPAASTTNDSIANDSTTTGWVVSMPNVRVGANQPWVMQVCGTATSASSGNFNDAKVVTGFMHSCLVIGSIAVCQSWMDAAYVEGCSSPVSLDDLYCNAAPSCNSSLSLLPSEPFCDHRRIGLGVLCAAAALSLVALTLVALHSPHSLIVMKFWHFVCIGALPCISLVLCVSTLLMMASGRVSLNDHPSVIYPESATAPPALSHAYFVCIAGTVATACVVVTTIVIARRKPSKRERRDSGIMGTTLEMKIIQP